MARTKSKLPPVELPADWMASEQGNTWLMDEEGYGHMIWVDLPGRPFRRLEIEITPECYPGFYVNVLTPRFSTDAFLAIRINETYRGWTIRTCHIDGVSIKPGTPKVGDPDDKE